MRNRLFSALFLVSVSCVCRLSGATATFLGEEPSAHQLVHRRLFTVSGELGRGGLAGGIGVNLAYNPIRFFSLDGGIGTSFSGPRVGLRARYNVLPWQLSPILGVGATGTYLYHSDVINYLISNVESTNTLYHLQYVAGILWRAPRGFSMLLTLGYAQLLNPVVLGPVDVLNFLTAVDQQSGPVTALSLGGSF